MRRGSQQRNPTVSPSPQNPTFSPRCTPSSAPDDEQPPHVQLQEWWLEKARGHEDGIAVGGFYVDEKTEIDMEYVSERIVKRHAPNLLEAEDGVLVLNLGIYNDERTLGNGFSKEVCRRFVIGFPYFWEDWKTFDDPYKTNSQPVTQPKAPRTSCSCDSSKVASASTVAATNDKGRDNDSDENKGCQQTTVTLMRRQPLHDNIIPGEATDVNPSEKGKEPASTSRKKTIKKSAAWNHDSNMVAKIDTDGRQKTHVASLKRQGCLKKPKHESDDTRTSMKGNLSPLPHSWPGSLPMSTPESLKLKKSRSGRVLVPALDSGCQKIVYARDGSISGIIGMSPPPPKGKRVKMSR